MHEVRHVRTLLEKLKGILLRMPAHGMNGSASKRFAVAALCLIAIFAIRIGLNPFLNTQSYVLFVPAIITIAWYCGLVPAVIATAVTLVGSNYFFVRPTGRFTSPDLHQVVSALVYIFAALFVAGLTTLLRREQQRAAVKAQESQQRNELLQEEIEKRQILAERLRERETLLNGFLENSPAQMFVKDREGRYLLINREFEKFLGLLSSEVQGKRDIDLFPPENAAAFRTNDLEVLNSGVSRQFEEITPDSKGLHAGITCKFPLRNDKGEIYAMGGFALDITERKRTEEALKESERRYRSLYTKTPVMMHSIDSEGRIVSVSDTWLTSMGYAREEVLGRKSVDFLTDESRERAAAILAEYFKNGTCTNVPYQMRKKNGEIIDVLLSATCDLDEAGHMIRSLAVITDVTAQKRAEKALRDSETKLRILAETAAGGIISSDSQGIITQVNHSAEQIFGYSASELLGKSIFSLVPQRFQEVCKQEFQRLGSPEQTPFLGKITELVGVKKDGSEFPLQLALSSWEIAEGKFFTGIIIDITERKEAEETLRRHSELLNLTQVIGFDLEDRIIFWTQGAEKLYGWTEREAMGENPHTLLRTEFPGPIQQIKEQLFATGHWEGELIHYRKNNEKITVASVWAIYKDPQGRAVAILESNNNITELKKTQAELKKARDTIAAHADQLEHRVARRTEQLQASLKDMEVFCYSIAHDLRAPLRAMSGFSQSLEQDYAGQLDATAHDYCHRINAASNRMNQLISDLLVYGRLTHQDLPGSRVDLTEEVEKVIERTSVQLQQTEANVEVQKPLPQVWADALVLDQVIENLLTNAVKFMPPERHPHIRIFAKQSSPTVRLYIEDNGIGILPEHLQRIFKPFERLHTTEYPGTGIGLAIVQRGIEKMGGHVGVESTFGKGSRFWIELPEHRSNS